MRNMKASFWLRAYCLCTAAAAPSALSRFVKTIVAAGGALIIAASSVGAASASETVTYVYDAKGRLVSVTHTGSVNNNVASNYTYDAADNRINVTVNGVPTGTLSSSSPTNTCTLGSNGICTLTIYWTISSGSPGNVIVKVGSPQTVFASSGAGGGSQDAPWIQAGGSTFYLYADSTLIATLYVHGTS